MKRGILAIVVVGLVFGIPSVCYPYAPDQGTFGMAARSILEGGLPYRDVFDIKPPAVYYVYAAVQGLLGTAPWTIRLADLLWQIATALVVSELGARLVGRFAGQLAAVVYLVVYLSLGFWYMAQPEGFLVLPLLGFCIMLTGRWGPDGGVRGKGSEDTVSPSRFVGFLISMMAGGLLGIAGLFKYTAVTILPLAFFSLSTHESPGGRRVYPLRLVAVAFGAAIPFGLWCMYARATGIWHDFSYILFTFTPEHTKLSHASLGGSLGQFLAATLRGFTLPWLCFVGLMAGLVGAIASRDLRRICRPVLLGLAFGTIGVIAQGKYWVYHFIVLLPWFALLCGAVMQFVLNACTSASARSLGRARVTTLMVLVLGSVPLVGPTWESYVSTNFGRDQVAWLSRFPVEGYHALAADRLAQFLKRSTSPTESVYIWGYAPEVYLLSGLRCPTRFVSNTPQRATYAPPELIAELLDDLREGRPAYVAVWKGDRMPPMTGNDLDSAASLEQCPGVAEWLRQEYRLVADAGGYEIHRRLSGGLRRTTGGP